MSEDKKLSAFKAFAQVQQTFEEAEEKAKLEAGAPRVERFRIGEDGEYVIRILPLAPSFDEEGNILPMDRKGYEYPLHQFFLAINVPSKKGGKGKKINIPVIRTTDKEVGYSVDLIDLYLKIAKEMYGDDEELMKHITGTSFDGGLRWGYQHALMVLDVSSDKERAKGPQLWQCSHSQYKDIDDAKMRLWRELREDGGQETCPVSGFEDAYPIKVIRSNNNGKTEYKIEIGRKTLDLKEDECAKLLDMPRIPEQIYRYTRYQFEATVVFLQQYDELHEMEVCKEPDFIEGVEKLKGELSADDTSHFDIAGLTTKSGGKEEETTVDSLWREYDAVVDQGLNEKSEEYQELREKIRQFIEDKGLDVRISRLKNNQQLLEELDEAMDEASKHPAPASPAPAEEKVDEEEPAAEPEPEAPKRRPRPVDVPEEAEEEPVEVQEEKPEPEPAPQPAEAPRRVRARRMR